MSFICVSLLKQYAKCPTKSSPQGYPFFRLTSRQCTLIFQTGDNYSHKTQVKRWGLDHWHNQKFLQYQWLKILLCPEQLKSWNPAVSACITWLLQSTYQTIATTAGIGERSFQELHTNPQPFPMPAILTSTLEATVFLLALNQINPRSHWFKPTVHGYPVYQTYRSVKFHEISDSRGKKESTWGCWWRLKEEVGRVSETETGKWLKSSFFQIQRCQKTFGPAGWGPPLPHQQHVRPELEPRTEIQHRKIICLSIFILSVFRKEHDNTSKPAVIPGYSSEGDFQAHTSTKKGAPEQTKAAPLRWQLWAFLGHTGAELWQGQSSDSSYRTQRYFPKVTNWTGQSFFPWRILNLTGSRHTIQIIRVLLRAQNSPRHQSSTGTCWQCPATPAQNQGKLSKSGKNAVHGREAS